jgi:predicted nucleic acid-binding protein
MGIAVDTNVLVALWNPDDFLNTAARTALDAGVARGELVICGPVYAELIAFPTRSESFLDEFLADTGIRVDWDVSESIWRLAGRAYKQYSVRRRRQGDSPRRILADFLIGAHALHNRMELLTFDSRLYRFAFPQLRILSA